MACGIAQTTMSRGITPFGPAPLVLFLALLTAAIVLWITVVHPEPLIALQ